MSGLSEKVTGYLMLVVGLLVIFAAVFSVYQVFTKQAMPINLFSFPGISIDLGKVVASQLPQDVSLPQGTQMQQEVIPSKMINDSANIAAHLFFMGFVASAGYKVASLGVEMLRPIQVKVRETTDKT